MIRVLISACLLGEPVRFDGGDKRVEDEILARWQAEGRLVPICPELAGGLGVPRPPAEIQGEGGGLAVLQGSARVEDPMGRDITALFVEGARRALALAREQGARVAVLTDRSPSCGSTTIHDGRFGSGMRPGQMGVTAALLRSEGLAVFPQHALLEAERAVRELEERPS
ncbi:DUF523 domain-containing protein [Paludibaculum fermentans]|uniref:DUF523 domain-containing protein n=1 Tax=Paludibaculum fermentans TaxID=1473598 RepID=A0A7S7NSN6_PALFE|nr:DUF523 domain-containing protein [Paludibaculum fermentans]QOY88969.1 DUF523 domain-containing protein [Paludibaculum fermentans]